jgi:tRNA(fMet)-specific endonuclease VapC
MEHKYLLDTNICIFILKNRYGVRDRVLQAKPKNCYVSEITLAELYYGAAKSDDVENRLKDIDFISQRFKVIPVFPSLRMFGEVKASLVKAGNSIDDFDILIGCTAITNNFILVTDNVKHLNRLPGIQLENWTDRNL